MAREHWTAAEWYLNNVDPFSEAAAWCFGRWYVEQYPAGDVPYAAAAERYHAIVPLRTSPGGATPSRRVSVLGGGGR